MKTKQKIFFAKIISRLIIFFLGKFKFFVVRNNINWELDIREGIDLSIFIFNNFEKSILETAIKLAKNIKIDFIDIGSNMGVHTLNLAKKFTYSKIYSIEATNFAFKKLKTNLDLNPNIKNIKAYQIFLSNQKFKQKKVYSSWHLGYQKNMHQKHLGTLKSTSNSKLMSLDNFIKKEKIKKKTIIKFDVDGNELFIFKSGKNYLKKYKPYIIMELAPYLYKENGYSSKDLLDYIKSLNYKFYHSDNFVEIKNIYNFVNNINDGSSINIFLK